MLKRFTLYSILILSLILAVFGVYRHYTPEIIEITPEEIVYNVNPNFNHLTIDSYITNRGEQGSIIFFYNSYDTNSIYVLNNILPQILEKYHLNALPQVVFCDITNIDNSTMMTTKNHWGFYQYPAFSNITYTANMTQIVSSLEWNNANIMTFENVENWLINNNILSKSTSDN